MTKTKKQYFAVIILCCIFVILLSSLYLSLIPEKLSIYLLFLTSFVLIVSIVYILLDRKKLSIPVLVIMFIFLLIVTFFLSAAFQTTPKNIGQRLILGTIRSCIWYEEDRISRKETQIILPETLIEFSGHTIEWWGIEELDGMDNNCDLIYNPKGYEDNTWIAVVNAKDLNARIFGNYVLWSDEEIRRKRGILKTIDGLSGLKYYSVKKLTRESESELQEQ